MAKIIIIVGEHPAEATAQRIGMAIVEKLKQQGHDVRFERIHKPLPKGGTLVAYRGSGNPIYQGKFDFRDDARSAQVAKVARENPDSFVFSFHNYGIPDYWGKTAKERNEYFRGTRQQYGGMFDPKTKSIIFQTSEHQQSIRKSPNLFIVEIPAITTENKGLDFPIANHKLSKQFGLTGEHIVQGIASKIHRIVLGKRMSVMKPQTLPRIIKRKKIRIR